MSNGERGSVTVIVAASVALMLVLTVWVVALALVTGARLTATTAADAAALAAAPVTFLPFGAAATPTDEAARFARLNGAELTACDCALDPSFAPRTVEVRVVRRIALPVIGATMVEAVGRADFIPALLLDG